VVVGSAVVVGDSVVVGPVVVVVGSAVVVGDSVVVGPVVVVVGSVVVVGDSVVVGPVVVVVGSVVVVGDSVVVGPVVVVVGSVVVVVSAVVVLSVVVAIVVVVEPSSHAILAEYEGKNGPSGTVKTTTKSTPTNPQISVRAVLKRFSPGAKAGSAFCTVRYCASADVPVVVKQTRDAGVDARKTTIRVSPTASAIKLLL
jgi:hypothetical protein